MGAEKSTQHSSEQLGSALRQELKVGLMIALVANCLIFSTLLTLAWVGSQLLPRNFSKSTDPLGFTTSLSVERRDALLKAVSIELLDFEQHREVAMRARDEVAKSMAAEPFDRSRLAGALVKKIDAETKELAAFHKLFLSVAERMTTEERRAPSAAAARMTIRSEVETNARAPSGSLPVARLPALLTEKMRREFREHREALLRARREVSASMTADAFDRARLTAALVEMQDATIKARGISHGWLLELAERMSLDERQHYVRSLNQRRADRHFWELPLVALAIVAGITILCLIGALSKSVAIPAATIVGLGLVPALSPSGSTPPYLFLFVSVLVLGSYAIGRFSRTRRLAKAL